MRSDAQVVRLLRIRVYWHSNLAFLTALGLKVAPRLREPAYCRRWESHNLATIILRLLHFRYYAVTAPIKYSMHRDNHARAYIFIAAAWVASVAIGKALSHMK